MTHTLQRPLASRLVPAAAVTAAAAAVLTGCSGSTAKASASPTPSSTAAAGARGARGFGGGVSGPIASVGSGSFTVTANSATDTVTYTGSTTFDRTAAGSLADVTAGSCVSVVETSGSDAATGSVDAGSVRISAPVNGSCTAGSGGAGGFPGGGGQRPTARPSGAPGGGGGFGGGGQRAGMLVGSVASVTGSSFIVTVTPTGSSSGTQATTTTNVTVSGSTTYTVTKAASAADLAVGACARVVDAAARPTGSGAPTPAATPTGPIAARSVTLSAPVNGSCGTGARNGGGNAGA